MTVEYVVRYAEHGDTTTVTCEGPDEQAQTIRELYMLRGVRAEAGTREFAADVVATQAAWIELTRKAVDDYAEGESTVAEAAELLTPLSGLPERADHAEHTFVYWLTAATIARAETRRITAADTYGGAENDAQSGYDDAIDVLAGIRPHTCTACADGEN